jgi:hypothetical protein
MSFLSYNYTCRTHLNARSRQHSVYCENSSFYAISQDTLAVAPHSVGGVRCANLARSATDSCSDFHTAQDVTFDIDLTLYFRITLDVQK